MKIENLSNRDGFSLIELLFAIVFLTIIVFGVIRLQTSNLALGNTRNNELQAHFLANQGVTVAEAIGFTDITFECGAPPCNCRLNGTNLDCTSAPESIDSFDRTLKIEENTQFPGAYFVTSIVEWTDSTGPHTIADGGAVSAKRVIYNSP